MNVTLPTPSTGTSSLCDVTRHLPITHWSMSPAGAALRLSTGPALVGVPVVGPAIGSSPPPRVAATITIATTRTTRVEARATSGTRNDRPRRGCCG
jgi:hypothetical protein